MAKQEESGLNPLQRFIKLMRADGQYYVGQREHEKTILQTQSAYSALSVQLVLILSMATAIASLGLMGDSAIAIVGAMLIAPQHGVDNLVPRR